MMYRSLLFVIVALVAVLAVGCVPPPVVAPGDATPASGGVETPISGSADELATDISDRAIEWLAGEASVAATDLLLVEAERAEWTDSCFGLGGPAESCLAAMTPGWRIVFEAGGQQYEVRTDEAGSNFRLAPQGN